MKLSLNNNFLYRLPDPDVNLNSKLYGMELNVFRNNTQIPPFAGEYVKITVPNYKIHIVKPTETLEGIASTYNIDKQKLISDNNLTSKIFIGQRLKISL